MSVSRFAPARRRDRDEGRRPLDTELHHVAALRFIPGTRRLVAAFLNAVELWDGDGPHYLHGFSLGGGFGVVRVCEPLRDSERMLIGGTDGGLRLLDLQGKKLQRFTLNPAAGAYFEREQPRVGEEIYSYETTPPRLGEIPRIIPESREDLSSAYRAYTVPLDVALSPDERTVAVAYGQGYVLLWDVETGALAGTIGEARVGHDDPCIFHVAWSPDGASIVTGDDHGRIRMWDARSRAEVRRHTVELSPRVEEDHAFSSPYSGGGMGPVRFSPDGSELLVAERDRVRRWLIATGAERPPLVGHSRKHPIICTDTGQSYVHTVRMSADGRRIFTVGVDATLRVWDAASGAEIRKIAPSPCCMECGDMSDDGTLVAAGSCVGAGVYVVDQGGTMPSRG